MNPEYPTPTRQWVWKNSEDLIFEDVYVWPDPIGFPDVAEEDRLRYIRTSNIISTVADDREFVYSFFTAQYCRDVFAAHLAEEAVEVWDAPTRMMKPYPAQQVLLCDLPVHKFDEETQAWLEHRRQTNDLKWLKEAAGREMDRRANRGSVMHQALHDWGMGLEVSLSDLYDYIATTIQFKGFYIKPDYCYDHVKSALEFADNHMVKADEALFEIPGFCHVTKTAGTIDYEGPLRNIEGVKPTARCRVDFKSSKSTQQGHFWQLCGSYCFMSHIGIPGTDQLIELGAPDAALNVYIQPEKVTPRLWPKDKWPVARRIYRHASAIWHLGRTTEQPVTVKRTAAPSAKRLEAMSNDADVRQSTKKPRKAKADVK